MASRANDLDSVLEAFEREHEMAGSADVFAFLPDAEDPHYTRIAVELIRVDLERSWARGSRKRLDAYRTTTPALFSNPILLAEIAFEEFRQRKQSGERVSANDYRGRYSIDISKWPADADDADEGQPNSAMPAQSLVRTAPAAPFPRVGELYAGFELVEQLGRGAFGVVFRAKQADLAARDVVLKITAARSVEPQRLARLQHTNIVPIYSMHEHNGLLAICMPYFGRRTFADLVQSLPKSVEEAAVSTVVERNSRTLPMGGGQQFTGDDVGNPTHSPVSSQAMSVDAAVEMIAQLAEALAHAQERGIVHSDIKPANVLLTDEHVPMLLDFNLSSDSTSHQKATLLVGGTLPYMAPEHLQATRDGGPVHPACDIYSLGVIAFELLTGQRPFPDRAGEFDHALDELMADRKRPVRTVRSLNPHVSAGLSSIVGRSLEPALSDRYCTAGELAEDLRRFQQDLPLRFAPERSVRERVHKWARRNARGVRWSIAASLVGLLVSLAALYIVRLHRLADLDAAAAFAQFEKDAHAALLHLHAPGNEPQLHSIGKSLAARALATFNLLDAGAIRSLRLLRLAPEQQDDVRIKGVELVYALGFEPAAASHKDEAIRYNTAGLALVPSVMSPKPLLEQRAQLLQLAGDDRGAEQVRRRLTLISDGKQDAYTTAVELVKIGDFAEAVTAWERLSEERRQDPLCWLLLGQSYAGVGRMANAEACYTALIALEPNSVTGYLYRGLSRADAGDFAAAERDYAKAVQLDPSVATTRINRALSHYALRNFDAAEQDATAAIAAGLADPRAYFVRALIREAIGKHDLAKADRDRGLTIEPIDDKGWVARGIAVLRDDPERAAREFEQGNRLYPKSKPLLQNLIHVYGDRLNRADEALSYASRYVDLNEHDSAALASRAVLYARKGDAAAATRDAERAAASRPSALTSLQLSCVYALLAGTSPEHAAAAIAHLRKSLASDPTLAKRAAIDPDLDKMKSNPNFEALISAATKLTESSLVAPVAAEKAHDKPVRRDGKDETTPRRS